LNEILVLAAFGLVASGTPGPNNLLLWASGLQFGFRASVPHIAGTSLGLGSMALAVAAGIGVLVTTVPGLALVLQVVGSIYLLFLAYQVTGIGALRRTQLARPLSLFQAVAFQYVNPKAWFFALAAIATFRPPTLPWLLGSALVAGTMMAVIIPTASAWAAGGSALNRWISDERARRAISIGLALTLAATVALIWI
jgi:threonine/homoserine/homoserine lactone efflux protein